MKKSVLFVLIFILSLNETICFAQINEEKNWEWADVIITEKTYLDSLPDTVNSITSSLYKEFNNTLTPEHQKIYDEKTLIVLKGKLIVWREHENEVTAKSEVVGYVYFIGTPGSNEINDGIMWISLYKNYKIETGPVLRMSVLKISNSDYVYGIYGSIGQAFTVGETPEITGFEDDYYMVIIPKIVSTR